MKKAIIVGCNGQDGRLLYQHLLRSGYEVTGIMRPGSRIEGKDWRIPLDISDAHAVNGLLKERKPDEVYYLAAHHHSSENIPLENDRELFNRSFQVHVHSLINFLEDIRRNGGGTRLFYAASSHIFGNAVREPQDESTPFNPACVYGITKTAGLHACRFYRNRHGLFASVGILYNHESAYRKPIFVTKKIITSAINIRNKTQDKLKLGNLNAEVDWGYAPDYVDAFQRILQAPTADDFIIATGIKHTVRDFVRITFDYLDLDWTKYVEEDRDIIAKAGVTLVGNPGKLMKATGWKPTVDLKMMIGLLLSGEGIVLHGK